MFITGFVLVLLGKLYVQLGNPGNSSMRSPSPGRQDPGQGDYVEPSDGGS